MLYYSPENITHGCGTESHAGEDTRRCIAFTEHSTGCHKMSSRNNEGLTGGLYSCHSGSVGNVLRVSVKERVVVVVVEPVARRAVVSADI